MKNWTRRAFVLAVPGGAALATGRPLPVLGRHRAAGGRRYAPKVLTPSEMATLEAIGARIFPSDETPGAKEARVADFVDHMLATHYAARRAAYRAGLRRLDAVARAARRRPFARLDAADQDALLARIERREVEAWPDSAEFFAMVRTHVVEGMFSDPKYHGNSGGVGWRLLRS
jgi:gluconate 2-dehydrogenase gamma chain